MDKGTFGSILYKRRACSGTVCIEHLHDAYRISWDVVDPPPTERIPLDDGKTWPEGQRLFVRYSAWQVWWEKMFEETGVLFRAIHSRGWFMRLLRQDMANNSWKISFGRGPVSVNAVGLEFPLAVARIYAQIRKLSAGEHR